MRWIASLAALGTLVACGDDEKEKPSVSLEVSAATFMSTAELGPVDRAKLEEVMEDLDGVAENEDYAAPKAGLLLQSNGCGFDDAPLTATGDTVSARINGDLSSCLGGFASIILQRVDRSRSSWTSRCASNVLAPITPL